jgi:hypothetical protein
MIIFDPTTNAEVSRGVVKADQFAKDDFKATDFCCNNVLDHDLQDAKAVTYTFS